MCVYTTIILLHMYVELLSSLLLLLSLLCTLIHSMPNFSNILMRGSSFASTITRFGSNISMFIESHLDPSHIGWLSGITGRGTVTNYIITHQRKMVKPYPDSVILITTPNGLQLSGVYSLVPRPIPIPYILPNYVGSLEVRLLCGRDVLHEGWNEKYLGVYAQNVYTCTHQLTTN